MSSCRVCESWKTNSTSRGPAPGSVAPRMTRDRDYEEALRRFKNDLPPSPADVWLDRAYVEQDADGGPVLVVPGPFPKSHLEERYADALEDVFGEPVAVRAEREEATPRGRRGRRAAPRLDTPGGRFAVRILENFVGEKSRLSRLLVIHGPRRSGKSVLIDWAEEKARGRAFRLDLARMRRRPLGDFHPRKPVILADGVEVLAGGEAGQRAFCGLLDRMERGTGRLVATLVGHPQRASGLSDTLRNRLLGGILVPVEPELVPGEDGEGERAPETVLDAMKECAARLFSVDRRLLDGANRRRSVVEARRTVMAAAMRAGLDERDIARAFRIRSLRTVREATRWARRAETKDPSFSALLREVGRVLPEA